MKKQVIILKIFILLSTYCFGQVTITKQEFEKLVDYANCKYVQAYIEKNDASKPYYRDTYLKKIKPELNKVNLDSFQTILSYDQLLDLLSNNEPAFKLVKKFNERKLKYAEFEDNESLLKSLITSGWNNVDLSQTAREIQDDLLSKYETKKGINQKKTSESDVVKAQILQTASQVEELQLKLSQLQEKFKILSNDTKIIEFQQSLNRLKLLLYVELGILFLLVIVLIYVLLIKLPTREDILNYVLGSKRVEDKFCVKNNCQQTCNQNLIKNNSNENYLTEKNINLIVDRVLECIRLNETESQRDYKDTKEEKFENSKKTYKYLKGQNGKIFSIADNSSENSFFRLFEERGDLAQFEFNGDEAEAIANRIFTDDVCTIISGGYQNAHRVITIKPGKIKRIGDHWEVVEKIEIKLE
ncbi:MAG TPA: hypothetical protein PLD12_08080 [Bacteroidales bacterium]|nr:hypothetical protein [Bacteroidales bacterium]HPO64938.1 hypothetical protein [Bacteroidales bacterium]